jgi:hypothetical protein
MVSPSKQRWLSTVVAPKVPAHGSSNVPAVTPPCITRGTTAAADRAATNNHEKALSMRIEYFGQVKI